MVLLSRTIKNCLLSLLVICSLSKGCEVPPKDTLLISAIVECAKSNSKFCIVKCVAGKTGIVTSQGTIDEEKAAEVFEDLPEGEFKDALKIVNKKCIRPGIKHNMKDKDCVSFAQFGACLIKQMDKRCPNVAQIIRNNM